MLVRQAAREQNEVTGGISLGSPYSLTSGRAATVYCCCVAIKHVRQGDIQVTKAWGGETTCVLLRNFANGSSSAHPKQKTAQTWGIFFLHEKKRSTTVLFLFSQVGSCISASHLRCQPSHMIVCLVKAYEHCHLVVISSHSQITLSHKVSSDKDGGLMKRFTLFLNLQE